MVTWACGIAKLHEDNRTVCFDLNQFELMAENQSFTSFETAMHGFAIHIQGVPVEFEPLQCFTDYEGIHIGPRRVVLSHHDKFPCWLRMA